MFGPDISGAGVASRGGMTATRCIIEEIGDDGVYVSGGSAELVDCQIRKNAVAGVAVYSALSNLGKVVLRGCTISENKNAGVITDIVGKITVAKAEQQTVSKDNGGHNWATTGEGEIIASHRRRSTSEREGRVDLELISLPVQRRIVSVVLLAVRRHRLLRQLPPAQTRRSRRRSPAARRLSPRVHTPAQSPAARVAAELWRRWLVAGGGESTRCGPRRLLDFENLELLSAVSWLLAARQRVIVTPCSVACALL